MPVHFISNSSAKIDNQKSVFSRQQSTTCARDYSRLFLDIAFGFHTRKPGGNYDLTISSDSLVHTRKIYFISVHLKYCLVVKNKHHQHRMYFSSGSPYRAKKITVVHHYELLFFYRENRTPHRKATVSLFDLLFSISSSIRPVSVTLTEEESLRHQPNETNIVAKMPIHFYYPPKKEQVSFKR